MLYGHGRSSRVDLTVFLAVLAAAFMHASWNVLVKLKLDRFLSLCLIQTLMGFMGMAMLAVFPWPSLQSVPYAVTSGLLHLGYFLFLSRSYRTGDLSQVYPIARGTAPLLTATADGGGYRLDGTKLFVPDGHIAELIIVAARKPGTSGKDGVSLFCVDASAAGVKRVEDITGFGVVVTDNDGVADNSGETLFWSIGPVN
jgi:hypothetical protein